LLKEETRRGAGRGARVRVIEQELEAVGSGAISEGAAGDGERLAERTSGQQAPSARVELRT
jgi:hypothetical protein